jgi:hypothetical protein
MLERHFLYHDEWSKTTAQNVSNWQFTFGTPLHSLQSLLARSLYKHALACFPQ